MLACVPAASSTVEDALGRDVVMANVQLFRLAISVTVPDVSDGGRFNQSTLGLNPNISSAGIAITVQPQSAVTPELRPQSILRPVILYQINSSVHITLMICCLYYGQSSITVKR